MSGDEDLPDVYDLLADEYARDILVATSRGPMSAKEISEECEMSLPTVYRRVESLESHDFLLEAMEVDTEAGQHHRVFEANLDAVEITLEPGRMRASVTLREDAADRFTRLWEGVRN